MWITPSGKWKVFHTYGRKSTTYDSQCVDVDDLGDRDLQFMLRAVPEF